jgi:hypothetical protein
MVCTNKEARTMPRKACWPEENRKALKIVKKRGIFQKIMNENRRFRTFRAPGGGPWTFLPPKGVFFDNPAARIVLI